MKRIIVATLSGLLFGLVCFYMASLNGDISWGISLSIISSRMLMGFGIGISRFKMGHWAIHGAVMGIIFSIPMACGVLATPASPGFDPMMIFWGSIVMGLIYGLLTEVITTLVFKAKQ